MIRIMNELQAPVPSFIVNSVFNDIGNFKLLCVNKQNILFKGHAVNGC